MEALAFWRAVVSILSWTCFSLNSSDFGSDFDFGSEDCLLPQVDHHLLNGGSLLQSTNLFWSTFLGLALVFSKFPSWTFLKRWQGKEELDRGDSPDQVVQGHLPVIGVHHPHLQAIARAPFVGRVGEILVQQIFNIFFEDRGGSAEVVRLEVE